MWDFINNHKKLMQVILAIMFLPFLFFGIDSYFTSSDRGGHVAMVAGQPITQSEFSQALRERQEMVQRMTGGRMDPALLDGPELRAGVLEGLVRQRLMIGKAVRSGIVVSDQQLQQIISEQPVFHDNGRFSHARYEELLRRQGMTPVGFESGLRRDLILERITDAYRSSTIVPNAVAEGLLRVNAQQREVSQSVITPEKFIAEIKIDPAAVKQYYEAHANEFQVPERARVDYVVLSLDGIASQAQVSADEVRQAYEQNLGQYAKGEERQASHILIVADKQASAEAKQAARAKAELLLKQVKQNPSSFAELAKKHSQDPGSAERGGDLGFFNRTAMVKPFADAAFEMKQGEIAGPIESDFGYHIIRLTGVKGRGFEDIKKDVELDLKRQKAGKRFSELAEQFNNLVFEQNDSLKPAADALKLPIQQGAWVNRNRAEAQQLNNAKLLQSIFSEDVAKNKRNTEVIDIGSNTLVAARIAEYQPPALRPLAEVSADITKKMTEQQAAQAAAKYGREMLNKLKQGANPPLNWSAPKLVSRENPQDISGAALAEAFRTDAAKLPVYTGVENPAGGFALLKISRVVEGGKVEVEKQRATREQLRQLLAQEELNAFVTSLKLNADVKIQQDQLGKKEE